MAQAAIRNIQNAMKTLAWQYDFAVHGGAVGDIATGCRVPNGAVIINAFATVLTAATSTNSTATIAFKANAANDIFTAAAVSGAPFSSTGQKLAIPDLATVADYKTMTAERELTMSIAVEALLGGKINFYVTYVHNSVA